MNTIGKLMISFIYPSILSLMPPFPLEMEQDESSPYLQQISSPNNSAMGFSGMSTASKIHCSLEIDLKEGFVLLLPYNNCSTRPISHGGITSSGMGNGTISGVHTTIQSPINPFMERVFHHGISSSIPNSLPSLMRVELLGNQSGLPEPALLPGQPRIEFQGTPNFHPHSLPEYHDGLINGAPCNSPGMAANISASPSERIENHQFCRVSSNGHPLELNDAVFCSSRNGSCSPGHHYI
ncbi:hypothetical protein HYC85_017784 [Camellia sinensis]|uniref:Uncharacterized protein n=1 Tax=Camellia sinensis TaxID=4442 RepID=A0A7J7GTC7_CAMSI|nr:hypothetical protein HYC85_017784 [Camellia sinensis]